MAIVFDWYENPNASSEEEAALHPRIFMNGKVDTDTLCYKIHDYSSLTVGDVKNVLDNLSKILGESLREGKEVHIEGIGYFYPTLAATGKVTRSTPHKTNKVAFKTVRFRPDSNLKGHFVGVRANQSKYVRHSEKVSEVEIDMLLKEYFAEHQMMTRRDFQEVCGLARTTAKMHLVRLRGEGKLVNIAAADGHPAEIMDLSFAVQAMSAMYIKEHHKELKNSVIDVSGEIDDIIARRRLKAWDIEIDELTEDQKNYLNSWEL